MAISEQKIQELKTQHGDRLYCVTSPDGDELVFRAPSQQEFDRWFDANQVGTMPASANARQFAGSCLVHPDGPSAKAVLERFPGMLGGKHGIVDVLTDAVGMTNKGNTVKKL